MIRRHFGSALTWMPLRTSSQHRFIHVPRRADLTFVMRDMMKMDGEEGGHYRNLLPPIPTKTASSSSSSSTSADGDEKMWSSVLNALMAKGDGGALSEHTPTPQDAYRAMLPKAQDPSSTYLSSAGSTSSWPWELPSLQYAARECASSSSSSSSSTTSAASLRAWARSSRCVIRALRKTSPELQSALLPGLHDGSTLGVACIGECVRAAIAAEEGGEGRLGCSVEATPASSSSSSSSSSSTSTAADAATARSKENAGAGEALFWEACNATGGCGGASSKKNKTSSSSPSSSSSAASTKEDGTATTPTPTHTPLEVFYLSGTVRWPSSLLTACGDELATPRVLLVLAKHVGRTEEWGLFAISTHLSTEDVQRMAGCGATDLHDGPQTSTLHVNHDARVVELRRCAAHLVSRPGEATMDLLRQLTKDAMMEDVEDAQACAEVAYQAAFAHCQRHVCGEESIHDGHRSLARAGLRGNDVMMAHPVIRKRVLMMKAYAEGGRALLVELNRLADAEMYAASEEMRQLAALDRRWLLPITHVALTKWGRDALTACKTLMMDGDDDDDEAHGVKKMRMEVEQHERLVLNHHAAHRALNTSRVAEDLLTESLATNDGGLQLQRFAQPINQLTRALLISWSASGEQGRQLWLLQKEWKLATARLRAAVMAEPKVVADFGEDYVLLTAQLSLGFYWLRMAEVARRKLAASSSSSSSSLLLDAEQKVWRSKVEVCDYVFTDVLPQTAVQLKVLQAAPLSRQTNTSHWMPS